MVLFRDRKDAAEQLSEKLQKYAKQHIVIGLAKGGVVIAQHIAMHLNLKWDVLIPAKITSPFNPEFALGALCEDTVLIEKTYAQLENIEENTLKNQIALKQQNAQRRKQLYHKKTAPLSLAHQSIILVDDGMATGLTMKAAIKALQKMKVKQIIIAIPVAPLNTIIQIKELVDHVLYISSPDQFLAVGQFYQSFEPVSDEQVIQLMEQRK